jgi:predicted O-methyltransferase YrrM
MLQVASEFDQLADIYAEMRPTAVLEIGVYQGGTLKVWLERCDPDATVVAVDNLHINRDAYAEWTQPGTELVVIEGVSQDSHTIAQMRSHAPYDFIFVDADHGYGCVRADAEVCLPLVARGGVLAFHDLVADDGSVYGPGMVVDELERAGHLVERFVEPGTAPAAHGIGVVWL